jgi:AraC family transcriptional regulator
MADVAAACGVSPGHFIKAFKTSLGQPPHQYLVNVRLAAAERLLVETELSFSEIAYLSGFSSQSHMTHTMRCYKLTTPGQIRKRK